MQIITIFFLDMNIAVAAEMKKKGPNVVGGKIEIQTRKNVKDIVDKIV